MALPKKPLEISGLDLNEMTLAEGRVFNPEAHPNIFAWTDAFGRFLAAHSNLTQDEIDVIKVGELAEVSSQLAARLKEVAVPLAKLPRSKTGRGRRAKKSLD